MRTIRMIKPLAKPAARKLRVAAYARVSNDALAHSFSAQVSYYRALIICNPNWEHVDVYTDEGISGTSTEKRKGFKELLKDCDEGKIDLILTKSISRFARNTVDLLKTVRHLKEKGIEVRFEKENISTLTSDGEVMLSILASFAQEESRSISENIRWTIRKKYQQGVSHVHRRTFGYEWNGTSYTIVLDEADAVRFIFERFIAGDSLQTVARLLADKGVVGINGTPLVEKTLFSMIRNEIYTGRLVLQKKFSANHLTRKNIRNKGELPKFCVEDAHVAIITDETFRLAQQKIAERRGNTQNQFTNPTVFSGKVVCGKCGNSCRRVSQRQGKAWRCRTKEFGGVKACDLHNPYEETLKKAYSEVVEPFTEEGFAAKVKQIIAYDEKIVFELKDGRKAEWQER